MSAASMLVQLEKCNDGDCNEALRRLASEFEDDLLGVEVMPDDYVDVLAYVLSSAELTRYSGAAQFALNAYLDFDKMTENQRRRILEVLRTSFTQYESEELCLVASDFLARRFPSAVALDALVSIGNRSTPQGVYCVQVALETLSRSDNLDTTQLGRVQEARRMLDRRLSALTNGRKDT